MNPATKKKYYTYEEYLALEEKAEYKSEYHDGEIVKRADVDVLHSRISVNALSLINEALKTSEHIIYDSNLKVGIEKAKAIVYPDASIAKKPLKMFIGHPHVIANPLAIIEVVSDNTANLDYYIKRLFYEKLPSLREYILVETCFPCIQIFQPIGNKEWLMRPYDNLNDDVVFESVNIQIPMSEIW